MKLHLSLCLPCVLLALNCLGQPASSPQLNIEQIHTVASNGHSLFMDSNERIRAIDTFLKLVRIKGPSGKEEAVVEEVRRLLTETQVGAVMVEIDGAEDQSLHNLIMEIPASTLLTTAPAILLNAHIDTIDRSTPEFLEFDPGTRDFYHRDESAPGKVSSFGGDDRLAVAVIVEAVHLLSANYWSHGIAHRRITLVFTADEERGCLGAKYLARNAPQLFTNLDLSLSMDGPLDLRSNYPKEAFVAVSLESDRSKEPYKRVLGLMSGFCESTQTRFGQTELGLGMGDFALFPLSAHAGLHLRSPVRGWHNKERVNLQDQINHVDLLCYIVLGWDQKLPAGLSLKTKSTSPQGKP